MAAFCLAGRVLEDSPPASRAGAAALLDVPGHYRAAPFPFPFAPAGTSGGVKPFGGGGPAPGSCSCTLRRPVCTEGPVVVLHRKDHRLGRPSVLDEGRERLRFLRLDSRDV